MRLRDRDGTDAVIRRRNKMEPIMWLILLACFLVVEAITVGLTTIWFAGGALVAAIASGLGAGS